MNTNRASTLISFFWLKKLSTANYTAACEISNFRCVSVSAEEKSLAKARVKDSADGQNSQNKGQARLICFVPLASVEVKFILFSEKLEQTTARWRETKQRERTRQQSCCFPSLASAQWASGVNGRASFTLMRRSPRVSPAPHAHEPQSLTHNKTIIVIVTQGAPVMSLLAREEC